MQKLTKLISNLWLPVLIIIISACQNEADNTTAKSTNAFSDETLLSIYEHQDRRNTEALVDYFDDSNPTYRAAAAEAMGSVQDSLAIPMLANLLNDENAKVRKAAAYALGQTYDSAAMVPLTKALESEDSVFVKRELFEALGKVVTQPKIYWLNQQPTPDPLEKEGLAWGIYRAGIRNVHDELSVGTAIALLDKEHNYETRLAAAHFLSRSRNLELKNYLLQLIASATQDSAANVRMAVVFALGKIQSPTALETLLNQGVKDRDYRVRVNAIRA
ncbi:HEAT repeat domain-containing protein, partial [Fulvivirga sp. RKSG066]|uniref:HEAT repeat domain-containing protein n=1 Tax=Fulvivirga aurantia TaxID=2529383 RepID=UPI00162799D0